VPSGVAVSPRNGDVYVTNSGSNTVSVISGRTGHIIATVPVGPEPSTGVVSPKTGNVYFINENGNGPTVAGTVSVISG
jgi:YVTN family beta-propeller protein